MESLEFFNAAFQNVMRKYSITHFKTPTTTPWKASMAERVVRTLKTRLWRWFQHSKSTEWVSVLQQFVENYNSTPHRAIGMAPNNVNAKNRKEIVKRLYPNRGIRIECKHRIGDLVRIMVDKGKYPKGYTPSWSEEIYVITKEIQSNGVCWYRISDQNGKQMPGIYYSNQLNLVSHAPPNNAT